MATTPELFNQYADVDLALEPVDAAEVRRDNLRSYFLSFRTKPPVFLLAEAPGPWGCRFSGVPITSEDQLVDPEFPLHGAKASAASEPYKEYSAGIFWRTLINHHSRFIVWNSVPFHPRKPGQPTSIRTPRTSELNQYAPIVKKMVEVLRPEIVVAIGRKAEKTLSSIGIGSVYVRHPSQGGATHFAEGISEVMNQFDR